MIAVATLAASLVAGVSLSAYAAVKRQSRVALNEDALARFLEVARADDMPAEARIAAADAAIRVYSCDADGMCRLVDEVNDVRTRGPDDSDTAIAAAIRAARLSDAARCDGDACRNFLAANRDPDDPVRCALVDALEGVSFDHAQDAMLAMDHIRDGAALDGDGRWTVVGQPRTIQEILAAISSRDP